VIDELGSVAVRATPNELRSFLAKFLFTGDDIFKAVAALSGGERSRLALAKLIYSRANVLVLDEPTNHLDIPSREALERALGDYPGTIITVSHDRYFLDRIATEILHFENGAANYHNGSYSDYYEERHRKQAAVEKPSVKLNAAAKQQSKPRANPQAKKRRPAETIEKEIHALEEKMAKLTEKLSSPALDWGPEQYAEIVAQQEQITSQLNDLYSEWESATTSANK
jgi:ATP-binding cassette subfamily F protein 3